MRVPRKDSQTRSSRYSVPKPTVDALLASEKEFNRTGTDFLKIDVATALTFSNTALSTEDPSKKRRNQISARHAYDTVVKMMQKVTLSDTDAEELKHNLERLKSDLIALGETF